MVAKGPIVGLVVVGGLLVGGWFVDRARTERRSVLSGTFESQPARLAPRITGRISQILVREGDHVRRGQTLVVLSARDTREQTAANVALAQQAESREQEVRAGSRAEDIVRQQGVVAEARASLDRARNGPLPEEIRAAARGADAADAQLRQLLNGPRREEVAAARAASRQAYEHLQAVRRGPTPEEKRQLIAKLSAADATLRLAKTEADRKSRLAAQGAIAVTVADQAEAQLASAQAARDEASEALQRANLGGAPEETAQAEAAYRQAQAQLNLLLAGARREEIDAARAQAEAAHENLRLLQRGTRSEDLRTAEAKLAQAQAALLELKNGSRPEQIAQSKFAARAAQNQAKASRSLLDETKVVAPTDGVVEQVLVAPGDLAQPGVPVVQFSDPGDLWLRVYIPENDLAKVSVGDRAILAIDGASGNIEAVVESIATQGEYTPANLQTPEERGKQVFGVRLRLAKPDSRVKAGMAATVRSMGRWH